MLHDRTHIIEHLLCATGRRSAAALETFVITLPQITPHAPDLIHPAVTMTVAVTEEILPSTQSSGAPLTERLILRID